MLGRSFLDKNGEMPAAIVYKPIEKDDTYATGTMETCKDKSLKRSVKIRAEMLGPRNGMRFSGFMMPMV